MLWCLEMSETHFCGYSYTLVSQGKINTKTSHRRGWAPQWESVGALVKMEVLIFDILFVQHSEFSLGPRIMFEELIRALGHSGTKQKRMKDTD